MEYLDLQGRLLPVMLQCRHLRSGNIDRSVDSVYCRISNVLPCIRSELVGRLLRARDDPGTVCTDLRRLEAQARVRPHCPLMKTYMSRKRLVESGRHQATTAS